jgi:hypothetical protein
MRDDNNLKERPVTPALGINNHGEIVGSYRIAPPRHALLIRAGQFISACPDKLSWARTSAKLTSQTIAAT